MNRLRLESGQKRKTILAASLFVAVFLYCAGWTWQGFDVTDEGYNLTNQWLLIEHSEAYWESGSGAVWLTDLVGGAWLQLVSGLGLIGARLGWALLTASSALVSFLVLGRYFRQGIVMCLVFATGVACYHRGTMIVNYNYLPAFLLLGATALILISTENPPPRGRGRRTLCAALGGVLLGLGVMARVPHVLSLVFPIVPVVVGSLFQRRLHCKVAWRTGLVSATFALLTIGVLLLGLLVWGHLGDYLVAVKRLTIGPSLVQGHDVAYLADIYLTSGRQAATWGAKLLGIGLGGGLGLWLVFAKLRRAWVPALLLGAALTSLLLFVPPWKSWYPLALVGVTLELGVVHCLLGGLFCFRRSEPMHVHRLSVIIMGAMGAVLAFAGSNNDVSSAFVGLWLLMPASFLMIPETAALTWTWIVRWREKVRDERRVARLKRATAWFAVLAVVALAPAGATLRLENAYRDLRNRAELTAPLAHPLLRAVYTSPGRAGTTDELMRELEHYVGTGDRILAYNSIPMIHFLTRTVPALGHAWPDLLLDSELEARLVGIQEERPHIVVRAKTRVRERTWGTRFVGPTSHAAAVRALEILDRWIALNEYETVWENRDFVIYQLPAAGTALEALMARPMNSERVSQARGDRGL